MADFLVLCLHIEVASEMFEISEKPDLVQNALLVRICFDKREREEDEALIQELGELVSTLDIGIADSLLAPTREYNKPFQCGTGKAQEIVDLARSLKCDCLIFDNALTPSQQRNWDKLANITVIDREEVILDIFASRAHTREARLQVDLARMQYALPRMTRMWKHLDREGGGGRSGGGGGAERGMGEQQIEIDRRLARQRIDRLKREIIQVRQNRATQRKQRQRQDLPHAALVGYTNAGKSSLLNRLTESEVFQADQLFATLDPTTRKLELPDGQTLLLTDTVGFIRNLPHHLIDAFKSTLEEALQADFLLHVVDVSDPQALVFHQMTTEVLYELGAEKTPTLTLLNKVDKASNEAHLTALRSALPDAHEVSARTGHGLEGLLRTLQARLSHRVSRRSYNLPHARGELLHLLHEQAKILTTEYQDEFIHLTALVSPAIHAKLAEWESELE